MPLAKRELVDKFCAKAALVNAVTLELPNMKAALRYAVDVCEKKDPCEMLDDEPGATKGPLSPNNVPTRLERIIAAPALGDAEFEELAAMCAEKGFLCLRSGLRKRLAGIDVGISPIRLGIAASGTCMADVDQEDARLAGMISEVNILLLNKDDIYPDFPAVEEILRERMNERPATYTTLITGPSRTADIERVVAFGAHGPLELHIILLEGQGNA